MKKLPWKTKRRLTCEREQKTESENGVINDITFCLGSPIEKTNSEGVNIRLGRSEPFHKYTQSPPKGQPDQGLLPTFLILKAITTFSLD